MNNQRKSANQAERDPDLAGAEAAMHRAARRARERAERVAGTAAQDGLPDHGKGRREGRPNPDPRMLSFSQSHGYEEIPRPLKLGELPKEARTRIWNLFYAHLLKTRLPEELLVGGPWIGGGWEPILRKVHTELDDGALDDWNSDFSPACKKLRDFIETRPFNKVFDLIQFVLRQRECTSDFKQQMQGTFEQCRLAYIIDIARPPTIVPAVTPEEGRTLVDAIRTLREAGLDGSASHLQKASEHLNASDWAGSVRESIHAVESVARQLDPGAAKTLGPALSSLKKRGAVHPALEGAFSKLYGYTSDQQGIRHPLLDQPDANVGIDEAVFMLGACASFASYLWRKHQAGDRL